MISFGNCSSSSSGGVPTNVSFSGKSRLEFDRSSGELAIDPAYDHSRALVAQVAGELGLDDPALAVSFSSSGLPKIAVPSRCGRQQLVFDRARGRVLVERVDGAKDTMELYRQHVQEDQVVQSLRAELMACVAQIGRDGPGPAIGASSSPMYSGPSSPNVGTAASCQQPGPARARPYTHTYTTSNGLNRLQHDLGSGETKFVRLDRSRATAPEPHRLQPEIDSLLETLRLQAAPSEPAPSKRVFGLKFRSAVRAVMVAERVRKKHEILTGYICIPRAEEGFTEERFARQRQYFAVLRRGRFMIFHTETEYDGSKGSVGTRASHVLAGSRFRADAGSARSFEALFASAAQSGEWTSFWTPDAVACSEWLAALQEAARQATAERDARQLSEQQL